MKAWLWAVGSLCVVLGLTAQPAWSADRVMPLSAVQSGMRCEALSVVRGTAVTTFDVEIVDVVRSEPGGARLLIRVSGPAVDETGIGPGFSGSPIYCPDAQGRVGNVGAISESVGAYGNRVALATPIEEMLSQRPVQADRRGRSAAIVRDARPLATPLTISGLSGSMRRAVLAAARKAGRPMLVSPARPLVAYPRYPLVPGSAVATGVSTGDIAIAVVGTVTYRDGARLWAFGHMFEGLGRRSLPLLDAYVYSVIDNPLGLADAMTYKLATPGRVVGTLSNDALSTIAGRVGRGPTMIPMTVFARNTATGRKRTLRSDVADERRLGIRSALDLVGTIGAGQAVDSVLAAVPPRTTTRLCLRVRLRQSRAPAGYCKRYFGGSGPFDDLSEALSMLDAYKFGPLGIERAGIRIGVRAGVDESFIVGARVPRRVRPGQRIRIALRLRRSHGGARRLAFDYRVPRSLRPGRRTLTIRGMVPGGSFQEGAEDVIELILGGGGGPAPPRSVAELTDRIDAIGEADGIRATFGRTGRGPVVQATGERLIRGKVRIPVTVRR